jgi:hypothetical protein
MRPTNNPFSNRPEARWRQIQIPSSSNDIDDNPFVESAEFQAPADPPDDDTRGKAVTIGQLGPLPEMEDELYREAREHAAREWIQAQNIAATSPEEARVRSLQFERDYIIERRNIVVVSFPTEISCH